MRPWPKFRVQPVLALTLLVVVLTLLPTLTVHAQPTTFYFHDKSELSFSYPQFQVGNFQVSGIQAGPSSLSARIFSAANSTPPTTGGTAVSMSAQIAISGQESGYAAFVAWVTDPFPATLTLNGNVTMHVWMSSNASVGFMQGSEYFMGVADYSPSGSGSFQLIDDYQSNAGFGNALSRTPTEYVATLVINQHQFGQGDMIMFFAGVGTNAQGYTFTVYFDNPEWESRADVPADPALAVPEFQNALLITTSALLLAIIQIKSVSKKSLAYGK
ncbi:MAG TPA: hypothetical protein VLV31_02500 [Candidatus Acidoferrales bacterium]|nr:hypothetical protein [Candidatus Acidoferrales bacterium]